MLKIFRLISFLEGVSYLLLLFIAVPIKYLAENEAYVKMLGMPHGLLFIAYIILAIMLKYDLNWKSKIFWNRQNEWGLRLMKQMPYSGSRR